jgi:hypothetical protein
MSIISVRRLGLAAASTLAVGTLLLGGCGGTSNLEGESHSAILLNPTPAEITPIMTGQDVDNRIFGITFDQNLLMIRDDLGRVMLFERPSRLSPYPVAYSY